MYREYLDDESKFVYPLIIKEKDKERTIITYKDNKQGKKFRSFHEELLEELYKYPSSSFSCAYKKGYCTLDAVKPHVDSSLFIKLDISSFFESITYDSFIEKINEQGVDFDLSNIKYCFYQGHLSLGYVTSPKISDMYLYGFDKEVEKYLSHNEGLKYTRYCDDLLISSNDDNFGRLHSFMYFIKDRLEQFSLSINKKKVREFDLSKDTSVTFLGLNIIKGKKGNIINLSKRIILKALDFLETYYKNDKLAKELMDEAIWRYRHQRGLSQDHPKAIESKKIYNESMNKESKAKYSRFVALAYINYIKTNSEYAYQRFLKKHINKFGFEWGKYNGKN